MLNRARRRFARRRLLRDVAGTGGLPKRALLRYTTDPFIGRPSLSHQNNKQQLAIAGMLKRHGFRVDVIDYRHGSLGSEPTYDLAIDVHPGPGSPCPDAIKAGGRLVAYITGSNPSVANALELERLAEVRQRRGVDLVPRRQARPFDQATMSRYHAMWFIGNTFNLQTYADLRLPPVHFITNSGNPHLFDLTHHARRPDHALFLASGGQIHKGLHFLLEAAARVPATHLWICSNLERERDFCQAYEQELRHLPNVHPQGFLNIGSERFRTIAARCGHMVLPSCSEARAGSVLTAMSAGSAPVVSRACGFEPEDAEVLAGEDYYQECTELLGRFADASAAEVASAGERARRAVIERYSDDAFEASIERALAATLDAPT